jgi:hypothetical protein
MKQRFRKGVALPHPLERQISYFVDLEDFDELLRHFGNSPWCQVLEALRGGFNKENPREPFVRWNVEPLDSNLKGFIGDLTNLDPEKDPQRTKPSCISGSTVSEQSDPKTVDRQKERDDRLA